MMQRYQRLIRKRLLSTSAQVDQLVLCYASWSDDQAKLIVESLSYFRIVVISPAYCTFTSHPDRIADRNYKCLINPHCRAVDRVGFFGSGPVIGLLPSVLCSPVCCLSSSSMSMHTSCAVLYLPFIAFLYQVLRFVVLLLDHSFFDSCACVNLELGSTHV